MYSSFWWEPCGFNSSIKKRHQPLNFDTIGIEIVQLGYRWQRNIQTFLAQGLVVRFQRKQYHYWGIASCLTGKRIGWSQRETMGNRIEADACLTKLGSDVWCVKKERQLLFLNCSPFFSLIVGLVWTFDAKEYQSGNNLIEAEWLGMQQIEIQSWEE